MTLFPKNKIIPIAAALLFALSLTAQQPAAFDSLAVAFAGKSGQLEIGGPYAGAAFHHSRPLPTRVSFYYPVANSMDLSTDYWQRDASQPFRATLIIDQDTCRLETMPCSYRYVPYGAIFDIPAGPIKSGISYRFGEDLPVMALSYQFYNQGQQPVTIALETTTALSLRSCQTYAWMLPTHTGPGQMDSSSTIAGFPDIAADSTALFIIPAGVLPDKTRIVPVTDAQPYPVLQYRYTTRLLPGDSLSITQLFGSCRWNEIDDMLAKTRKGWRRSTAANAERISTSVSRDSFSVPDRALRRTLDWSRAVLATNQHYLDGKIVPMPCPAEYNFFFTHDLLLTDLGAVMTDSSRVKRDLLYLHSLAKADSILPHAYYWRDSLYQTELCGSDNWNHLWFILVSGAYLRHSHDTATLRRLFPILQKSLAMMLQNCGSDNLMYAFRPDWWDIGHVYGARAYITSLTIRALREYAVIAWQLGEDTHRLAGLLKQSGNMRQAMSDKLWNEKRGFLMNMHDQATGDPHYYAGSLLAAVFGQLDERQRRTLLETARRELLDKQIGLRIAMPADFHTRIEAYQFNGMEAGEPYVYLNGGVWPHGNAWYALGWLMSGEPDSAKAVLSNYLTLNGIAGSPNGQPSFYEYRRADPDNPRYGEIDKPTFLWAGGWFIHVLYQLAGVRETPWHIALSPDLPDGWNNISYDLLVSGGISHISYKGEGDYFSELRVDGKRAYSALLSQPSAKIELSRGTPQYPYLEAANGHVEAVEYNENRKQVRIEMAGFSGLEASLNIISPDKPASCTELLSQSKVSFIAQAENSAYRVAIRYTMATEKAVFLLTY